MDTDWEECFANDVYGVGSGIQGEARSKESRPGKCPVCSRATPKQFLLDQGLMGGITKLEGDGMR
jgi:hypothetical protein